MDDRFENRFYLECSCSTKDHVVAFDWYRDRDDPEIYVHVQLHADRGFWCRLWTALRYVFNPGGVCRYGVWTECLVNVERAKQLRAVIDEYVDFAESCSVEDKRA